MTREELLKMNIHVPTQIDRSIISNLRVGNGVMLQRYFAGQNRPFLLYLRDHAPVPSFPDEIENLSIIDLEILENLHPMQFEDVGDIYILWNTHRNQMAQFCYSHKISLEQSDNFLNLFVRHD